MCITKTFDSLSLKPSSLWLNNNQNYNYNWKLLTKSWNTPNNLACTQDWCLTWEQKLWCSTNRVRWYDSKSKKPTHLGKSRGKIPFTFFSQSPFHLESIKLHQDVNGCVKSMVASYSRNQWRTCLGDCSVARRLLLSPMLNVGRVERLHHTSLFGKAAIWSWMQSISRPCLRIALE